MEGPSLFLAAEWLKPFMGKKIEAIEGNTKIGKERMLHKRVLEIFSWGKHLVFQFDTFALRVHFMLFGSFEAIAYGVKVTGDYPTKDRPIRLRLSFDNGTITLYSCSIRFIESADAKKLYDYSIDIMSPLWDEKKAIQTVKKQPEEEIGDILLDQSIFAGVGNIIKNEVLFLTKMLPTQKIEQIKPKKLKEIVATARSFSYQFYLWRKDFVLKKHYQIYRKSLCPKCQGKVTRKKTGKRERQSFFCQQCQR